jgi:phage shock protein E
MNVFRKMLQKLNPTISVEKAVELLQQGATLVDVRSPSEFAVAHADMAINIPLDSLTDKIQTLPDKAIIVHCQSGGRSQMAMKQIQAAGRTGVYNLGGLSKALKL